MPRPFTPIANWNGISNSPDTYLPMVSCSMNAASSSIETDTYTYQAEPGTYRNMSIRIDLNTGNTASGNFRKNGANGNQTVIIPAGTSGTFNDLVNTDTVVVGDVCNIQVDKTGGNIRVLGTQNHFQPTDVRYMVSKYGYYMTAGLVYSTNNVTRYLSICGSQLASTATESNLTHMQTDIDFTAKNLQATISSNGRSTNTTIRFRNGTTNGNMSIVVPGGGTGTFSVSPTTTDFVLSGTRPGYSVTTLGSGGNFRPSMIGVDCYTTASNADAGMMLWAKNMTAFGTSASIRCPVLGALSFINSSGAPRTSFYGNGRIDMFRVMVSVNANVDATNIFLVKNGITINSVSINIPGLMTGEFSNLTSQDYFVSGDTYNYLVVTTMALGITLEWFSARAKFNQGSKPKGSWW